MSILEYHSKIPQLTNKVHRDQVLMWEKEDFLMNKGSSNIISVTKQNFSMSKYIELNISLSMFVQSLTTDTQQTLYTTHQNILDPKFSSSDKLFPIITIAKQLITVTNINCFHFFSFFILKIFLTTESFGLQTVDSQNSMLDRG